VAQLVQSLAAIWLTHSINHPSHCCQTHPNFLVPSPRIGNPIQRLFIASSPQCNSEKSHHSMPTMDPINVMASPLNEQNMI